MSSKTAVSPVIVSALRWMKMTVENAVPDCGRQRLQWQRTSTIGFSVILEGTAPHIQRPVSVSGTWGASSLIVLPLDSDTAAGPGAQVIVRTILKRAWPDIIR